MIFIIIDFNNHNIYFKNIQYLHNYVYNMFFSTINLLLILSHFIGIIIFIFFTYFLFVVFYPSQYDQEMSLHGGRAERAAALRSLCSAFSSYYYYLDLMQEADAVAPSSAEYQGLAERYMQNRERNLQTVFTLCAERLGLPSVLSNYVSSHCPPGNTGDLDWQGHNPCATLFSQAAVAENILTASRGESSSRDPGAPAGSSDESSIASPDHPNGTSHLSFIEHTCAPSHPTACQTPFDFSHEVLSNIYCSL